MGKTDATRLVPERAFDLSAFRIRYEPDPLELAHLPSEARQLLIRLATAANTGDSSALRQAERAVEKYPDVPQFKNYLAVMYELVGTDEQIAALVEQTATQHPDYLFARLNKLAHLLIEGEMDAAEAYFSNLGGPDLHDWYPGRSDYNVVEIRAFYRTLALYFASFNDPLTARRYLRVFRSLGVDRAGYEALKRELHEFQLTGNLHRMNQGMRHDLTQDGSFQYDHDQTDQPPIFTHPEVTALYDYGLDLPESVREQILSLPPDSLREDLERVLLDALRRYQWFLEKEEEWVEEAQTFPFHGLALLRELAPVQSLPLVLTLLRQGEEFLDYWFADQIDTVFVPVLRALGDNQWAVFNAFLREPDVFWLAKGCVLKAIEETALFQPERQPEARELVGELLHFFYENRADSALLDANILADLAVLAALFQATDLLPLIERCFAEGIVAEFAHGDFPDILAEFEKSAPDSRKPPHPAPTAAELYAYWQDEKRAEEADDDSDDDETEVDTQALLRELEEKNSFGLDDDDAFFARLKKPATPAVPALGRNDKVSVRYPDGRTLSDVKYKKVEDDLKKGKCLLIS